MNIYSIISPSGFNWILMRSDPRKFDLPGQFEGWALLSPLCSAPDEVGGHRSIDAIDDERFLVFLDRVDFVVPDNLNQDAALEQAQKLLRWLRFATGQARLGTDIAGHRMRADIDRLARIQVSAGQSSPVHPVRHYEFSAITFDLLSKSTKGLTDYNVPVYGEVLLDALEASFMSDDRKAILYAAISVEAMAATRVRELFDAALSSQSTDLRVVNIRQHGGSATTKDPVFDVLESNAKRNFKMRLHEQPLYVMRRSMRVEQQALYDELLAVHKARNELAHGAPQNSGVGLPVDHVGARRAIDSALRAFAWFAASGRYVTLWNTEYDSGGRAP
jgi:hypothetical protein